MNSLLAAVPGGSLAGPLAALSLPSSLTHPEPWHTCAERSPQALAVPGACWCVSLPGEERRENRCVFGCSSYSSRLGLCARSLQAWLTVCDLIEGSPPGSSARGLSQARILECHFLLQGVFPTQGSSPHLLNLPQPFAESFQRGTERRSHALCGDQLAFNQSEKCNSLTQPIPPRRVPHRFTHPWLKTRCVENGL